MNAQKASHLELKGKGKRDPAIEKKKKDPKVLSFNMCIYICTYTHTSVVHDE